MNKTLLKKCHMKFSSLYNNTPSQKNLNNNKIKVNRDIFKVSSPMSNPRMSKNKKNNIKNKYSTVNRNKTKNYKSNNNNYNNNSNLMSPIYLKDVNYIRYININVDLNKINYIQIWWKYMHKIIYIQKNIRAFIIKKKMKKNMKYYNFISIVLKVCFSSFFNNIHICYIRYYFQKWKEIIDKDIIFNKIFKKKLSKGQKNNNNNNKSINLGNIKKKVLNTNSTLLLKDKII